jgi:protoporphyrinogen IX oxidase
VTAFLNEWHLWIKAFHVVFVVAWMAGLFYLPRLFVYHAKAKPGSELDQTLQVMELKLLRVIMDPAIVMVWILGVLLLLTPASGVPLQDGWIWVKLGGVLGLTLFHHALARWRKDFAAGANTRSEAFYRRVNEIPAVLLIVIVVMVIVRPF